MSLEKHLDFGTQVETSPGRCSDPPYHAPDSHARDSQRDEALDFLQEHDNAVALDRSRDSAFTRGLRKKIDFSVLPFLWFAYTLCFIDKVLLNVRNLTGCCHRMKVAHDLADS